MNTMSARAGLGQAANFSPASAPNWEGLRQAGLLRSAGRDPLVLAFVSRLCVNGDEPDIERIRAEVRGLGVTMLLISDEAVWCFGADDSLRKARAPSDVDPGALRDLFERFGMVPTGENASENASEDDSGELATPSGLRAVFVIDPAFVLRFVHVVATGPGDSRRPARSTLDILLRGLVASSAAFEKHRPPGVRLSFSELTTLAVVSGMERVLGGPEVNQVLGQPAPQPRAADGSPLIGCCRPWSSRGGQLPADRAPRPALVPISGAPVRS